jgi:hypothetical protein
VFGQLTDPLGVHGVGLTASPALFDVLRVDQPALVDDVFQQVEHRFPVHPGGLHRDPGDAQLDQPVPQQQQLPGHRGVAAQRLAPAAVVARGVHRHHHLGLADVDAGAPQHLQLDHDSSLRPRRTTVRDRPGSRI